MKIPLVDAGAYFRGLLLLIRKDHKITEPESVLIRRIGRTLGFEKEFCDNAIREILVNEHILDTPPRFSTRQLAEHFVKDGLTLAFSDKEVAVFESEWLRATAEKNGLDLNEIIQQWRAAAREKGAGRHLEVDDITVEHS